MAKRQLSGAVILALLGSPAMAQMETPKCAAISDANLPADLAGWAAPAGTLGAAAAPAPALPKLAIGKRTTIALLPAAHVAFAVPPEKVRQPEAAHSGLVAVSVPAAGPWRISASKGLWIDVLSGAGSLVASTAFGALAPCTTIHKVVEFPLTAGDYVIQLNGNPGETVDLMISPKP